MNYNPLDYRRPYERLQQAGRQFAGAIGSAVAEIPEVVELRKNTAKNEDIYNEDVLPQIKNLTEFDMQLTGFKSRDVLAGALRPEKGETNVQYVSRVAKALAPIAQYKASQSIEMKKEQKDVERKQYVGTQLREAAAGGNLPAVTGAERYRAAPEPVAMTKEVSAGEDITSGPTAPPARYMEQDIVEMPKTQAPATSREEMLSNLMERQRRQPPAEGVKPIGVSEAKEDISWEAFPDAAESRKLKALDIEEERVRLAKGNLSARLATLDFQKTKEVTDVLQQAYKWAIESGKAQKADLPPLFNSSGYPTVNTWTPAQQQIAQNLLNQYDMAIQNMKNRATVTDPRNAFFSGGVNVPTQPSAPTAQPAPQQSRGTGF